MQNHFFSINVQIIGISVSLLFMFFIFRLIIKGKLREEYSVVWIFCTIFLLLFSIWRKGIDVIAQFFGIYYPPTLLLLVAFFSIVIFLVHLSIVNSKQHEQIKKLAHEIAFIKKKLEEMNKN